MIKMTQTDKTSPPVQVAVPKKKASIKKSVAAQPKPAKLKSKKIVKQPKANKRPRYIPKKK